MRSQRKQSQILGEIMSVIEATESKENVAEDRASEFEQVEEEDTTRTSLDSSGSASRYQRDLQLLEKIKKKPKAFSKARMGENGSLTLENLRRRNGSNESLRSSRSGGSFSINGSEPAINLPKAWGRKARPGSEWMSRITERKARSEADGSQEHDVSQPKPRQRSAQNEIDQWMAAAEVPLPGSEPSPSHVGSSRSAPRDPVQRSGPLPSRHSWNVDDDFTGRSLQVSDSPPLRLGRSAFGDDTTREIRHIERQAVTTNRLGQLKERLSETDLPGASGTRTPSQHYRNHSPSTREALEVRRMASDPSAHSKLRDVGQPILDSFLGNGGESVANTPVVIYKDKKTGVDGRSVADANKLKENQQPSHERRDSQDLLKRLARAASQSPSPEKDQLDSTVKPTLTGDKVRTPQVTKSSRYLQTPVVMGAWVDQSGSETPQAAENTKDSKTPHVTGGWIATPLPTGGRYPSDPGPELSEIKEESSPEPTSAAADLVKELNPNTKISPIKTRRDEPPAYTGPPLPKSALSNIINRARGGSTLPIIVDQENADDPTLHLGEATIEDLEEMIAHDYESSSIQPVPRLEVSSSSSDPSPPSKQSLKARNRIDPDSQTHLLSRLTDLAPSLRDSKKQIAALERQLSDPKAHSASNNPIQSEEISCVEGGELHDFLIPCTNCGHATHFQSPAPLPGYITLRENLSNLPSNLSSLKLFPPIFHLPSSDQLITLPSHFANYLPSLYLLGPPSKTEDGGGFTHMHLTFPLPRLWCWPRECSRPRLTWLGLMVLVWVLWSIVESWAREVYCHKLFASSMVGYGVDITAPKPPLVIFKVIWAKWGLREVVAENLVGRVVWKFVMAVVGYFVDFVFGGEQVPLDRDRRIPPPPRGPDISMMNDEYL